MVTRHEFLVKLHELLQPETYLEIGVHHGDSLLLSQAPISIGVDPEPRIGRELKPHHNVVIATSDKYFEREHPDLNIDLAFIDGMHLWEFAARDFLNIWRYSSPATVVVFDDVLPTTVEMAARTQCAGDWTGDVWKVYGWLESNVEGLRLELVDTFPTGMLLAWKLPPNDINSPLRTPDLPPAWMGLDIDEMPPPTWVLNRELAISADEALRLLKEQE